MRFSSPGKKISSYFPKLSQEPDLNTSDDIVFKEVKKTEKSKLFPLKKQKKSELEDLELAIAISRSVENPGPEPIIPDGLDDAAKTQVVRKTLEQFGFKSNGTVQRTAPKSQKRRKNKFTRTVLHLRTEDDRRAIIENKVAEIVRNIESYNDYITQTESTPVQNEFETDKPGSFLLRDLYDCESSLFKKASQENGDDESYFNALFDPSDSVKAGTLLRDWREIPGREPTPPRDANEELCGFSKDGTANTT